MRRIIIFTLLALTMLGSVAFADRWRHRNNVRDHRSGGVYVQPNHSRSHYRYNNNYRPRYNSRARIVVRPQVRVVRRPIYVQRPVIQFRYYNQYQRPALIAENYPAMAGYIWVPGQWQWSGYEWTWQPGHYEPDPSYNSYQYAPSDPYQYNYQQPYDSSYQYQQPYSGY